MRKKIKLVCLVGLLFLFGRSILIVDAQVLLSSCGSVEYQSAKQKFENLIAKQTESAGSVDKAELAKAARIYLAENEKCYDNLYKSEEFTHGDLGHHHIDEGGLWFDSVNSKAQSENFVTQGTKWGRNSPFTRGRDRAGPGTTGGVVTYGFMGNGVSHAVEGADSNRAISSFPRFQSCFINEIEAAFVLWSAVADIEFRRVSDNGVPSNSSGTSSDIRIGGHTFDGSSGVLAHAFFPPPNGNTIAGDMHFDRDENWTCNASGIDIGIVAIHELGHAIGLRHEESRSAIMNPFYNPAVSSLLRDDINGAVAIYGPANGIPRPENNAAVVVPVLTSLLLNEENQSEAPNDSNPSDACSFPIIDVDSNVSSEWDDNIGLFSQRRNTGVHADYYRLILENEMRLKIDLVSGSDTYLYVANGCANSGSFLYVDDDGGGDLNAQLIETFPAGEYLIEATTFSGFSDPNYTLSISVQ